MAKTKKATKNEQGEAPAAKRGATERVNVTDRFTRVLKDISYLHDLAIQVEEPVYLLPKQADALERRVTLATKGIQQILAYKGTSEARKERRKKALAAKIAKLQEQQNALEGK